MLQSSLSQSYNQIFLLIGVFLSRIHPQVAFLCNSEKQPCLQVKRCSNEGSIVHLDFRLSNWYHLVTGFFDVRLHPKPLAKTCFSIGNWGIRMCILVKLARGPSSKRVMHTFVLARISRVSWLKPTLGALRFLCSTCLPKQLRAASYLEMTSNEDANDRLKLRDQKSSKTQAYRHVSCSYIYTWWVPW